MLFSSSIVFVEFYPVYTTISYVSIMYIM